jgi:predicted MFS family arabinose efflux permease
VLLGAGLALVVTGARTPAWWLPLVAAGIVALGLFAWWERHAADPVVDLRLFANRAFSAGSLIIGLQNFAMYALLFELPLVFATSFGANAAQSGRALLAMTLAMVVGSVVGGRVASAIGSRRAALLGAMVSLAGGLVLMLQPLASVTGSLPALLPLGLGLGLTTPAANTALMTAARAGQSGMASALSGTMRYIGGIAGVAVVSAIVSGDDLLAAHSQAAVIFASALGLATMLAALIPSKPGAAR